MDFTSYLQEQMAAFGLPVTAQQLQDFTVFYESLIATNEHMNLTAITEPHEVAIKHMIDSLSCYDPSYFPEGASVLDLGTGGGFPGIPLAIYRRDLHITLFDSLQKRLRFLDGVIDRLGLTNVRTLHGRAEDCAHQAAHREQYDLVTSRAVARLQVLAEWALPYVKVGGTFISLKGAAYEEELAEGQRALQTLGGAVAQVKPVQLPTLADKRAVLYIRKEKACGKKYPRKPKEIKERPL